MKCVWVSVVGTRRRPVPESGALAPLRSTFRASSVFPPEALFSSMHEPDRQRQEQAHF
jgi:hypothetical protein